MKTRSCGLNMGRPRTGKSYVTYQHDREHQRVVRAAGIDIPPGYVVHHKDGGRRNNSLDNLEVMSNGDHARLHFGIKPNEPRACEYVPEECSMCFKIHMVQYRCTKRINYTGLCKSCNGKVGGVHAR